MVALERDYLSNEQTNSQDKDFSRNFSPFLPPFVFFCGKTLPPASHSSLVPETYKY